MIRSTKMIALGILLAMLGACEEKDEPIAQTQQLVCYASEPFLTLTFANWVDKNQGAGIIADGPINYRFPNNIPPEFVGQESLTPVSQSTFQNSPTTRFELSNGMTGDIIKVGNNRCNDGMSARFDDYEIRFYTYAKGQPAMGNGFNYKQGCCYLK